MSNKHMKRDIQHYCRKGNANEKTMATYDFEYTKRVDFFLINNLKKRKQSAREDVEKLKLYIVGRNVKRCSHVQKFGGSSKR